MLLVWHRILEDGAVGTTTVTIATVARLNCDVGKSGRTRGTDGWCTSDDVIVRKWTYSLAHMYRCYMKAFKPEGDL